MFIHLRAPAPKPARPAISPPTGNDPETALAVLCGNMPTTGCVLVTDTHAHKDSAAVVIRAALREAASTVAILVAPTPAFETEQLQVLALNGIRLPILHDPRMPPDRLPKSGRAEDLAARAERERRRAAKVAKREDKARRRHHHHETLVQEIQALPSTGSLVIVHSEGFRHHVRHLISAHRPDLFGYPHAARHPTVIVLAPRTADEVAVIRQIPLMKRAGLPLVRFSATLLARGRKDEADRKAEAAARAAAAPQVQQASLVAEPATANPPPGALNALRGQRERLVLGLPVSGSIVLVGTAPAAAELRDLVIWLRGVAVSEVTSILIAPDAESERAAIGLDRRPVFRDPALRQNGAGEAAPAVAAKPVPEVIRLRGAAKAAQSPWAKPAASETADGSRTILTIKIVPGCICPFFVEGARADGSTMSEAFLTLERAVAAVPEFVRKIRKPSRPRA